ncbi:MAG: hypothetical protein HQ559_10445 [Lentisphaerae bacterium]|nr:hypothetical protein [Lentisphaerota bacterium]
MMGITDYSDIDKFDRDKPVIQHDLNVAVPDCLCDRFNLIVDSGTIEHIFDVRQVMANIVQMCRTGGWVVHIAPASNFMDHGFYCMSPTFFYDYYSANGFGDFSCYLFQVGRPNHPPGLLKRSRCFRFHYGMKPGKLLRPKLRTMVFFAARKRRRCEAVTVPVQGCYVPASVERMGALENQEDAPGIVPESLQPVWKKVRPFMSPLRPLVRWIGRRRFGHLTRVERI